MNFTVAGIKIGEKDLDGDFLKIPCCRNSIKISENQKDRFIIFLADELLKGETEGELELKLATGTYKLKDEDRNGDINGLKIAIRPYKLKRPTGPNKSAVADELDSAEMELKVPVGKLKNEIIFALLDELKAEGEVLSELDLDVTEFVLGLKIDHNHNGTGNSVSDLDPGPALKKGWDERLSIIEENLDA